MGRGAAGAILRRPDLWWTGLRQARRMARRDWWRRPPFLPLPGGAYWRFRLETVYGAEASGTLPKAVPADLIGFLEWCRAMEGEARATLYSR